jgi:PadR family transcriptional regulator, regulatory protein AphA
MSTAKLSAFSYRILALVGRGGAGAHDLARMAHRGRIYAYDAPSQYYAEPKRLARLGYLAARKEPGKTRERTHYTLTEKGLEALRDWAPKPTPFPRINHEGVTRLLAADLVGEAPVRESVSALRSEIADLSARLDEAEAVAETLPYRRKYLLLNLRLARRLLAAHLEWVNEVEQELTPPRRARDSARPRPELSSRKRRTGSGR